MSYQVWSVVFGEQPSASKWNILGTNDASFHDGTGIDDIVILTRHLADKNVTTRKMKPTYYYVAGSTGGARQSLSGTAWTVITGASQSYTSGPTAEILLIGGNALVQASAAGSTCAILAGGSPVGRADYADTPFNGVFYGHIAPLTLYEIAANTTITIAVGVKLSSGTGTVANGSADIANGYSPSLNILAFARA